MKRLLSSWFSVLATLGRTVVWERSPISRRPIRRPAWESLEPRHLLTATYFGHEAMFLEQSTTPDSPFQSSVFSTSSLGMGEGEGGLSATAVVINAVDDEAWEGVVATFQDSTLGTDASDYEATINWGEVNYSYGYGYGYGNQGHQGTIESLGNGQFAVRGTFAFTTEADPMVTVSINRIEGPSIATESTAKVHGAKPIYVSAGVATGKVELTSVSLHSNYGDYSSGYYNEYGNHFQYSYQEVSPSNFTTTVDWGDGTPLTSALWEIDYYNGWGYGNSFVPYRLFGTHTYATPGDYEVRVNINPVNSSVVGSERLMEDGYYNYQQHRGFSVTDVKVFQQTLTAEAHAINAVDDQPWSGIVATFQDSTLGTDASDYEATINWGEVNYSYGYGYGNQGHQGTIESLGNGQFAVRGTYTYSIESDPQVTVAINRIEGPSIVTHSPAKVHGASPIFSRAEVPLNQVELTSVTLVESSSGGPNGGGSSNGGSGHTLFGGPNNGTTIPSNFTATVDWGDGTPVTGATWERDYSGDSGYEYSSGYEFQNRVRYRLRGSHTYAVPGDYEIRTTISPVSQQLQDDVSYVNHRGYSLTFATALPIVAVADNYATDRRRGVYASSHSVLDNDINKFASFGDEELTAYLMSPTAHGIIQFESDGNFSYTPNDGFLGTDTFTYSVSNGEYNSNIATVSILVENHVPVANNDVGLDVHHSRPSNLRIKDNDHDADGDLTQVVVVTPPQHGTLVPRDDGTVRYYPEVGYLGPDAFEYKLWDGDAFSNIASVTMQVTNKPPVAPNLQFSIPHDRPFTRSIATTDAEGDALQLRIKSLPTSGLLSLTEQTWKYTPSKAYVGADSFTYTYFDGLVESPMATVSFDVTNHAPIAVPITAKVPRNNSTGISLVKGDSDADYDLLQVRIDRQPLDGRLTHHDGGAVLYERWPEEIDPNWTDSFEYSLFDGIAWSAKATVGLSLANSQPYARADQYRTDIGKNLLGKVIVNDQDPDGDQLRIRLQPNSGPTNAKIFSLNADGTFVYVPNDTFQGTDSFTYEAYDPWPVPGRAVVAIYVGNSAPEAKDLSFSISMDESRLLPLELLANDVDGDPLSVRIVSDVSHGILSVDSSGPITYLPRPGYAGTDSFTYIVSDGRLNSLTRTVSIEVREPIPSGWGEVFYGRRDQTISSGTYSLLRYANDGLASGELPMTVSLFSQPDFGSVEINPNGTFVFMPQTGFDGQTEFEFRIHNGYQFSTPIRANVIVGSNVSNDYFTVLQHPDLGPYMGSVRLNDSSTVTLFANGVPSIVHDWSGYSFQVVQPPLHSGGSFLLNANGTFSYVSEANYVGDDSFTYVVVRDADDEIVSREATVSLYVRIPGGQTNGGGDPPTPQENGAPWILDRTVHVQTNGSVSDWVRGTDPERNTLTYEFETHPRLSSQSNGNFTYAAVPGFTGSDHILVRAFDGTSYSLWSPIFFEVSNQTPIAFSQNFTSHWSNPTTLELRLLVIDSDRDPLQYTILSQPSHGSTQSVTPGFVTYSPNPGFLGSDSFTFRVFDGQASSTGTITIKTVNNPPQINVATQVGTQTAEEYWVAPSGLLDVSNSQLAAQIVTGGKRGRIIPLNEKLDNGEMDLLGYLFRGGPQQRDELLRRYGKASKVKPLLENDRDLDGDPLTVQLVQNVAVGRLDLAADGTFVYYPDPNRSGDISFTYRVYDGIQASETAIVVIHVQNTPPISRNISLSTGRLGTVKQKANDSKTSLDGNSDDKENATLTYTVVTGPTKGTVTINADGSYVYTNSEGLVGTDSFTYRSYDGVNYSQPATVTVAIINDAPVAKSDVYEPVRDFREGGLFDAVYSVIGDLPTDDPNRDPLSVDFQSGPFHGTFDVDASGRFVYKPTEGYIGQDSVIYRVSDGLKSSNLAELKFTMRQSAPKAVDDLFSVSSFVGEVLNIGAERSILRNDTDNDDQALTAHLWRPIEPGKGTVTLQDNGTFVYDPQGYIGNAEFSYYVNDGVTNSLPSTVRINAQAARFETQTAPIVVNIDQAFTGTIARFDLPVGTQPNTWAFIQWYGGAANAMVRATGLGVGMPQWEVLANDLILWKIGMQSVSVFVTDSQQRTSSVGIDFRVNTTPPTLIISVTSLPVGLETSIQLATFVDSRGSSPNSYSVRIDWGDGTESEGSVRGLGNSQFAIIGNHPYQNSGTNTIQIKLELEDGQTSSASKSLTISSQLILDRLKVSPEHVTNFTNTALASFSTNAPASVVGQLVPIVYWGDGSQSTGTFSSLGNGTYDVLGYHNYTGVRPAQLFVVISDPLSVLEAFTAVPTNPHTVWFTQGTVLLNFETLRLHTLTQFYGNSRGNQASSFSASIQWNSGQPTTPGTVTANGHWYRVRSAVKYSAPGSYQPTINIHRNDGTTQVLEQATIASLTVSAMTFLSMPNTLRVHSGLGTVVAKFTASDANLVERDFVASATWSDGVTSAARVYKRGIAYEVETARKFTGTSKRLISTIQIHSVGAQLSDASGAGTGGGEGEGGSASNNGSNSQPVVANATPATLFTIEDSSTPSCPRMYRISLSLTADDENLEEDSDDDKTDRKKIRQDKSGRIGKLIIVNSGDSNDNGTVDHQDNVDGAASLVGEFGSVSLSHTNTNPNPPVPTFNLSWNTSALRLWSSRTGSYKILSPGSYSGTSLGIGAAAGTASFMVEGLQESSAPGDQIVTVKQGDLKAEVRFTVNGAVDVDVDSNNDSKLSFPERSPIEDADENSDSAEKPGKIVLAATLDSNGNGVPDFADGLRQFPDTSTWKLTDFVPLIIQTPKFFDRTIAKIKISYSASDPNAVTKIVHSNTPGDVDYNLPSSGLMRLWTKEANSHRESRSVRSQGDFVGDGEFTMSQIQPINLGSRVILFIEGVREGEGRITVSFDSDGNGSFETTDTVKISVAEFKLVYTDVSGYREVGQSTVASIPRIPSDVEPDGIAADWQPGVEDGSLMFVRLVGSQVLDKLPGGLGESQITFGNWENSTFKQLGSAGDWTQQVNGALYSLDDPWLIGVKSRLQDNSIKVPGDNFGSSKKVYAGNVYRSPIEFNLSNLSDTNRTRDLRPAVKIQSQVETTAGKSRAFVIVRPAVVLVHGINSNPETWNIAVQALQARGFETEHFRVNHGGGADHGNGAIEISSQLVAQMTEKAIASFQGAEFQGPNGNSYRVFPSLAAPTTVTKPMFPKTAHANAGRKIVAQKVDVIAHSYGGLLSRWYMEQSGTFEAKRNVRKLITLGTPHLGSPQANMVREVLKNGLIANAKAEGVGSVERNMLKLMDDLQYWEQLFVSSDGIAANGNHLPAFETLPVNSLKLQQLASGKNGSGPFQNDVGYAAVFGTDTTIDLGLPFLHNVSLNKAFVPLFGNYGTTNDTPYFPWIKAREGVNDSVVPDWSAKLGVDSYNFAVAVDHGNLPKNAASFGKAISWLNGNSNFGDFGQVPLGANQRATYRRSPPDWATNAYEANGTGLNRDAIIKVELDPLDKTAWYGTRPPAWSADPNDNMLGIRQVKVTGMVEKSSATSVRVSILNAEASTDTLLSTMATGQEIVTYGAGNGLVPFSVNLDIGRAKDGITGLRGHANNFSVIYNLYARVVDSIGNPVPGFSSTNYMINATPNSAIEVPEFNQLFLLEKDPVNGLRITARGAFEIEAGGSTPTSDILRIYSDDFSPFNTLIHEVVVLTPAGFIGWNKLLVGYKTTFVLTRDANGKVKGNKASSGLTFPWIFQYLTGLNLSSPDVQVP